jgi:hypothetical protein
MVRLPGLFPAFVALLLTAASPVLAVEKVVDAGKVFARLDSYLQLPPGERNHFTAAYYIRLAGQPYTGQVWLLAGAARTALRLNAQGRVEHLPTAAQLAGGKLLFGVDASARLSVVVEVEPLLPPAAELDARELAAAVIQASAGVRKSAGILAVAAPKFSNVGFVGAPSGEVEFADGRRSALPLVKGVPTYTPAEQPNAKRIRLPRAPDRLEIG